MTVPDEDRIYAELEAIKAQLESLTKSIGSNTVASERRFATLEVQVEQTATAVRLLVDRSDSLKDSLLNGVNGLRGDVVEIKEWKKNHEKRITELIEQRDERNDFIDGAIKDLARAQGKTDANVVLVEKDLGKFKTAVQVVVGILTLLIGAAETLLHIGRH